MADTYLKLDAAYVAQQIDRLMLTYADVMEDDDALRADMIEGSTDLDKVVSRALDHMLEADGMVAMIKDRCNAMSERQGRYQRRSDAMRGLIKELMEHANLRSLPLPEATVSLANGRQTVVITSVDELPQGYVAYEPKPDKKAIGEALKAGEDIPGAMLQTGDTSLTVRRK
jgi:hypothetical protein